MLPLCFSPLHSCEVRADVQEAEGQPVRGGAEAPAAAAGAATAAGRGGRGTRQGVQRRRQQRPRRPGRRRRRHLRQRARHRPAQVRGFLQRGLRPAVPGSVRAGHDWNQTDKARTYLRPHIRPQLVYL